MGERDLAIAIIFAVCAIVLLSWTKPIARYRSWRHFSGLKKWGRDL